MRVSVARQFFLLQAILVLLMVAVAAGVVFADERESHRREAREQSTTVALTVAANPMVVAALHRADPARVLQPYAERVRRDTGTDFVVVMALDRTRYSHPDPAQLGRRFIGDLGDAPEGGVFTQQYTGTLGPSMRAVVPVREGGEVVALVSVGITVERIDQAFRQRMSRVGLVGGLLLLGGAVGTWLVSRRLRRQTHGLGEQEITRMYEYYDSVLHAVREGLVLLDQEGRVQLVNDEGRRLLALGDDVVGRTLAELGVPAELVSSLTAGDAGPDEVHVLDDLVLVVNQAPARWEGRLLGSVVTLRDHTELRAVSGQLDTVTRLTETLRAQNHEASNRLHTIVSLIELGRPEEAVSFATDELRAAQSLADRVTDTAADSVVSALLLGKTAQAAERGVELVIAPDTRVDDPFLGPGDMVTLVGNLVDNAFDAVADTEHRVVEVLIRCDASGLVVKVGDSGPGLSPEIADKAFQRGWSTKADDDSIGRGLGLALVGQVARRHGGRVGVGRSGLGGAQFTVEIPRRAG